jgi:hypothetical protein
LETIGAGTPRKLNKTTYDDNAWEIQRTSYPSNYHHEVVVEEVSAMNVDVRSIKCGASVLRARASL